MKKSCALGGLLVNICAYVGRWTQCLTWAAARLALMALKIVDDALNKAGKSNIAS